LLSTKDGWTAEVPVEEDVDSVAAADLALAVVDMAIVVAPALAGRESTDGAQARPVVRQEEQVLSQTQTLLLPEVHSGFSWPWVATYWCK
jgi:hypothetical protein